MPVSAWALGLGKLNVQSSLGEPLRAEIDVTSLTQDEGGSLQVRVATPETYRAAGVDYNQVLTATRIVLQRRTDGRPYLRITSDRSVQEPFVDVILDLSWSSGRLVREYTLLFDPPSTRANTQTTSPVIDAPAPVAAPAPAPAPVAVAAPAPAPAVASEPAVKPATTTRPVASATASEPLKVRNKGKKAAPAASEAAASTPAEAETAAPAKVVPTESSTSASTGSSPSTVRVKSGDSLSRIASRTAQQGVSLDQMLVGLYRNNPQAFLGNNMNRLKSGVVLNVPTAEQAKSVSNEEARQIIVAQSADFAAYRQHLAGAVTATAPEQPQRQAKGKVEAEVQDKKQTEAPAPDKLTLSKGGMSSSAKPAAEDRLAKSRAKQEEAARVAELSKNLDDLRKLKEKAAAASVPAKVVPPAPVAPSKPAVVVPPAPVPAPAPAPAPAPVPSKPVVVEAASTPASATVAEAVASAASEAASSAATAAMEQASAAEAAASSARPSLPVPVPPPAQEPEAPGFLESLNPMLLAAGGAAVALLAGAAMYFRSRRRGDTGETSFLESRLQPDSFFGASGGQRVDTRDATGGPSSMSYSLSQLDAIGDVDPVAEADVYLAYGRDLQAEEILKEALRSTPDRLAVRTKLLEVYAKRRDTKGYEQLAAQLYNLTGGQGEDWAKAQEMGLGIDPENPLYQPGGQPSAAPLSIETPNDMLGASTIPHSVMPAPSMLEPVAAPMAPVEPEPAAEVPADLVDLDLDISAPAPLDEVNDSVSPPTTEAGDLPPLELPEVETTVIEPKTAAADTGPMDLPMIDSGAPAAPAADAGLDFDLGDVPTEAQAPAPAPASFDLSSISLDLDAPAPAPAPEAAPEDDWLTATASSPSSLSSDPMNRKFELAEEFRQIGDVDGARELLQEVLENSQDDALKARAQGMLDSLG
ncbi:MAG TPA: FimV/HubP family polar landmark protein [Aquabacterium sp.]|uniref:FimV/HubP family polar landmark protein n=1 Tax=Aquabacterium sp. TaxID=1872578 RepID=UPI002E300E01|nr:FimV/HubP family polar landmark protein [Aquabacterium sp.]HEX5355433.1 FimV/HubP family polar landmark protein [Aquabacterium sp.]